MIKIKKINKEKFENILCVIGFVLLLLWSTINIIQTCIDPPTLDDLTVEEKIQYERMIFP